MTSGLSAQQRTAMGRARSERACRQTSAAAQAAAARRATHLAVPQQELLRIAQELGVLPYRHLRGAAGAGCGGGGEETQRAVGGQLGTAGTAALQACRKGCLLFQPHSLV